MDRTGDEVLPGEAEDRPSPSPAPARRSAPPPSRTSRPRRRRTGACPGPHASSGSTPASSTCAPVPRLMWSPANRPPASPPACPRRRRPRHLVRAAPTVFANQDVTPVTCSEATTTAAGGQEPRCRRRYPGPTRPRSRPTAASRTRRSGRCRALTGRPTRTTSLGSRATPARATTEASLSTSRLRSAEPPGTMGFDRRAGSAPTGRAGGTAAAGTAVRPEKIAGQQCPRRGVAEHDAVHLAGQADAVDLGASAAARPCPRRPGRERPTRQPGPSRPSRPAGPAPGRRPHPRRPAPRPPGPGPP